jgi:hypothetical protein
MFSYTKHNFPKNFSFKNILRKSKVFLILLMEASLCNVKNNWKLKFAFTTVWVYVYPKTNGKSNELTIVCLREMKSRAGQLVFFCQFKF